MIGRTLGNYRIMEQIGMGGMATVYKAYDPDTDRYVAIKVLPEHFSKDPRFRQRFEREAKAIAKLEHIHILPLFAYGEDEGVAYMVMRYLDAGSLTERIRQGALPLAEAGRLLSQIASALDHAHAHGVLHRDVKPSNVLLDSSGNAFLMDFGIAKMVESTLDLTGASILGTPAYMSPEQCRGAELTSASDQYSLGIILYEMVTGRTPFRAETPIALIHMQLNEPLPLPRQVITGLPEEAERVILKALTKDPSLRFPTCGDMAAAFARAVASVTVEQPAVDDLTIASAAPPAVTTPAVEGATVLHGTAEPAAMAPRKRRRLPAWAIGLVAVVVVLGLAAVVTVVGLMFFGEEEQGPSSAEDLSGVEGLSGAEVGEIGEQFWDFESGDAQDWTLDDQGWQVIEAEGGYVLEGRASEAEDSGPPIPALPPGLVNYENFHLAFDMKYVTGGMPNVFFRDRSGTSNCFFYDLILPPQNAEIWKQAGPCGPPDLVLDEAPTPTGLNTWHTVELLAVGSRLEVIIDEQEVLSLEDDEPLPAGSLYFGASGSPGSTFYIDNVHIIPFAAEEEMVQAQSPPEPGPVVDIEPPTDTKEVRPCDWEGHGSGLCIYAPPREEPIQKILEEAGLDLTGPGSWSPDGRQIAFSAFAEGQEYDMAIYIVNADGTELTQLPQIGDDLFPAWSPDGEWLAFRSNCGLAVMHPDGSEPNVLWPSEADWCTESPQWSPDSQSIVVSVLQSGGETWTFPMDREVWVVTDEGNTLIPIATLTHNNDNCLTPDVAFNPDGAQVAYVDDMCQTLLANADGSGAAKGLNDFPFWWTAMVHPQWGEGKALPITGPEPGEQPAVKLVDPCEDTQPSQICVFDVETEQTTQISDLDFESAYWFVWSPDGQQIVFDAGSDPETGRLDHKLYLINADGSGLKQLTTGDTNDILPVWSPDGNLIAFHRDCGLWVVRPDGSQPRELVAGGDRLCASTIDWSPDSQQMAFLNKPDDETVPYQVFVLDPGEAAPRLLQTFDRSRGEPLLAIWSRDGQQLALWFEGEPGQEEVFLINADGSGEPKLINEHIMEAELVWSWFPNFWPRWGGE